VRERKMCRKSTRRKKGTNMNRHVPSRLLSWFVFWFASDFRCGGGARPYEDISVLYFFCYFTLLSCC
jgi:hypothetical protein